MKRRVLFVGALVALCATAAGAQMPEPQRNIQDNPVLMACKGDIKRFCSEVAVGEGRVKACMKSHLPELSEPCKEALFQAWLRD